MLDFLIIAGLVLSIAGFGFSILNNRRLRKTISVKTRQLADATKQVVNLSGSLAERSFELENALKIILSHKDHAKEQAAELVDASRILAKKVPYMVTGWDQAGSGWQLNVICRAPDVISGISPATRRALALAVSEEVYAKVIRGKFYYETVCRGQERPGEGPGGPSHYIRLDTAVEIEIGSQGDVRGVVLSRDSLAFGLANIADHGDKLNQDHDGPLVFSFASQGCNFPDALVRSIAGTANDYVRSGLLQAVAVGNFSKYAPFRVEEEG